MGRQLYHLHVPIVLKYGSLNILEPLGPVQDCKGIALSLLCHFDLLCPNETISVRDDSAPFCLSDLGLGMWSSFLS